MQRRTGTHYSDTWARTALDGSSASRTRLRGRHRGPPAFTREPHRQRATGLPAHPDSRAHRRDIDPRARDPLRSDRYARTGIRSGDR